MCEALHYGVVDLKRVRIMNIELGKLNLVNTVILMKKIKKILLAMLYVPVKETMQKAIEKVKLTKDETKSFTLKISSKTS